MNLLRPIFAIVLAAAAAGPASASYASNRVYKGAIVMDAASGAVLFADHADEVSPPASMTKLMTFAVIEDRIRDGSLTLKTRIDVSPAAARVGMLRDSTSVWLRRGEAYSVEELIYAMMIQSANAAAYALAEYSTGSVPAFVALMNAKARELGMANSRFRSPNGLPPPSHRIADGDLTVQATDTEDITGAIADSINYAIEALRELVTTIAFALPPILCCTFARKCSTITWVFWAMLCG